MGAAVENVHHRHRHDARERAAKVAIERHADRQRRGARRSHRHGEERVGAELRLVWRAVELQHRRVDSQLVRGVATAEAGRDRLLDIPNGVPNAFAAVAVSLAVAQLDRLVLARAGAARNSRSAKGAVVENNVGFDGGIAAAIEDLAGVDVDDLGHDEGLGARC